MTILYNAIENTVASKITAASTWCIMGRLDVIQLNIQCSSFLYSDWLYLLWHGMFVSKALGLLCISWSPRNNFYNNLL